MAGSESSVGSTAKERRADEGSSSSGEKKPTLAEHDDQEEEGGAKAADDAAHDADALRRAMEELTRHLASNDSSEQDPMSGHPPANKRGQDEAPPAIQNNNNSGADTSADGIKNASSATGRVQVSVRCSLSVVSEPAPEGSSSGGTSTSTRPQIRFS